MRDAYDIRRHPDTGKYEIPFVSKKTGNIVFTFTNVDGDKVFVYETAVCEGMNILDFPQFMAKDGQVLNLTMTTSENEYSLPLRLH